MVNLRRSLNAERTEFAETFHAENAEPRRCAEAGHHSAAGGCRPPLDRCRAQRAPPACCPWHFSPRDSAPPRPLREVLSARSAARCRDGKIIQVRLLSLGSRAFVRVRLFVRVVGT